MSQYADAAGKWLIVKGQQASPVRCLGVESDHLWVESAPGLGHSVYPEEVLSVLGTEPPAPEELASFVPQSASPAIMEPNQALSTANAHFPPEARLRKSGYRLADRTITLTFDFPDAARERYAGPIASLRQITGWQVEVTPETNQSALNSLVREVLPQGWQVGKGPAIHRDQKRVAVTVLTSEPISETSQEVCGRFQDISGWELSLAESTRPVPAPAAIAPAGTRMEINAAYSLIKSVLEGSTLYRTSLKGEEIVLSFISPQVGRRYQEKIAGLAVQTSWSLSISPQPNQGAIMEAARAMIAMDGFNIAKGPSIYPEKAEVSVVLATGPTPEQLTALASAFEAQTGFRLAVTVPVVKVESVPRPAPARSVEVPLNRIRMSQYQQSLSLDPARLEKSIERARLMGIAPPVQLKRTRDGYLLVDGLYRLRAAEALGLERIPASCGIKNEFERTQCKVMQ